MDNEIKLAPCPCGKTPTELDVVPSDTLWAIVQGDCCGEWAIEFRLDEISVDSKEAYRLACEAWNNAPRSKHDQKNPGAKPGYRLLTDSDTIQRDDEFLEDDCNTWTPVSVGSRAFVGLRHNRDIYQPIRRKSE